MAAHAPESEQQELHHRVPQCLLRLRERADAHPKLDGEGLQLWLDYELEALRARNCRSTTGNERMRTLLEIGSSDPFRPNW
jgi:hypothetical protein